MRRAGRVDRVSIRPLFFKCRLKIDIKSCVVLSNEIEFKSLTCVFEFLWWVIIIIRDF